MNKIVLFVYFKSSSYSSCTKSVMFKTVFNPLSTVLFLMHHLKTIRFYFMTSFSKATKVANLPKRVEAHRPTNIHIWHSLHEIRKIYLNQWIESRHETIVMVRCCFRGIQDRNLPLCDVKLKTKKNCFVCVLMTLSCVHIFLLNRGVYY